MVPSFLWMDRCRTFHDLRLSAWARPLDRRVLFWRAGPHGGWLWATGLCPVPCGSIHSPHMWCCFLLVPIPNYPCDHAFAQIRKQQRWPRGPSMARLASCAGVRAVHPSSIPDRLACLQCPHVLDFFSAPGTDGYMWWLQCVLVWVHVLQLILKFEAIKKTKMANADAR
jgi:hypothetical protein